MAVRSIILTPFILILAVLIHVLFPERSAKEYEWREINKKKDVGVMARLLSEVLAGTVAELGFGYPVSFQLSLCA